MSFEKRVLRKVARVYPKRFRDSYADVLMFLRKDYSSDYKLGTMTITLVSIFITSLLIGLLFFVDYIHWIALGGFGFIVSYILVDYLLLYFKLEDKKKNIESVLPDFLHICSSNLRAGYTPFQALKSSARDEFGELSKEVQVATSSALGSGSFEDAITSMNKRIQSKLFGRILHLFITSMHAGSRMADLLEETAKDVAETQSLKKELSTGTKSYTMFILFTVIIASPMLFSISLHFTDIMSGMQADDAGEQEDSFGLGMMGGKMEITTEFMRNISLFMIISTSIFSAMLIGVISEGNKKHGLRYAPAIAIVSTIIFFIARKAVSSMF